MEAVALEVVAVAVAVDAVDEALTTPFSCFLLPLVYSCDGGVSGCFHSGGGCCLVGVPDDLEDFLG